MKYIANVVCYEEFEVEADSFEEAKKKIDEEARDYFGYDKDFEIDGGIMQM